MTTWIKADPILFPVHAARLVFSRNMAINRGIEDAFKFALDCEQPDYLMGLLKSIICIFRPDLEDANIEMMCFDYVSNSWNVTVTHPSLPFTPMGGVIKAIRLDEQEDDDA